MPTVMIAGANRGLGLEFARQYLADGWSVIATARDLPTAKDLRQLPGIELYALDVTAADSVSSLVTTLGDRPLDVVICNAGIYGPKDQSLAAMDYKAWLHTFEVNTLGPFRLAAALLGNLKAAASNGTPKLAFITSLMGSISDSSGGTYAYRSSKAALNLVGHGLAQELKRDGVAVLLLHPGWVQTDMGGPNAPLKAPESISGLRDVIENATLGRSGSYLDYRGKTLDW